MTVARLRGRSRNRSGVAKARLEGKRCIVTGGSRGIGLAIGEAFARAGAKVAFTYAKSDDDADAARKRIARAGTEPLLFKGSVADGAHVRETVRSVTAAWGGVDVLVNNAGINEMLPFALIDEKDWEELFDINVKGPYLFAHQVLRVMYRQKAGNILNVGSFASERCVESPVHYAAAKSALRGMTEALALEAGRYDIRVNLIAPGVLEEGLSTMVPQHRVDDYLRQSALGRLGSAEELAKAAVFLVSDENTFMTGAKIVMDGGL